jgi:hypothetical protein
MKTSLIINKLGFCVCSFGTEKQFEISISKDLGSPAGTLASCRGFDHPSDYKHGYLSISIGVVRLNVI